MDLSGHNPIVSQERVLYSEPLLQAVAMHRCCPMTLLSLLSCSRSTRSGYLDNLHEWSRVVFVKILTFPVAEQSDFG